MVPLLSHRAPTMTVTLTTYLKYSPKPPGSPVFSAGFTLSSKLMMMYFQISLPNSKQPLHCRKPRPFYYLCSLAHGSTWPEFHSSLWTANPENFLLYFLVHENYCQYWWLLPGDSKEPSILIRRKKIGMSYVPDGSSLMNDSLLPVLRGPSAVEDHSYFLEVTEAKI